MKWYIKHVSISKKKGRTKWKFGRVTITKRTWLLQHWYGHVSRYDTTPTLTLVKSIHLATSHLQSAYVYVYVCVISEPLESTSESVLPRCASKTWKLVHVPTNVQCLEVSYTCWSRLELSCQRTHIMHNASIENDIVVNQCYLELCSHTWTEMRLLRFQRVERHVVTVVGHFHACVPCCGLIYESSRRNQGQLSRLTLLLWPTSDRQSFC